MSRTITLIVASALAVFGAVLNSTTTQAEPICAGTICVGATVLCPDEATGYFSNVGVVEKLDEDATLKARTLFNHTIDHVPPAGTGFTAHTDYCSPSVSCDARGFCAGDRVRDAVYGTGKILYLFIDLYDSAYVQFDDEYVNGARKNPWTDVYFLEKLRR